MEMTQSIYASLSMKRFNIPFRCKVELNKLSVRVTITNTFSSKEPQWI